MLGLKKEKKKKDFSNSIVLPGAFPRCSLVPSLKQRILTGVLELKTDSGTYKCIFGIFLACFWWTNL